MNVETAEVDTPKSFQANSKADLREMHVPRVVEKRKIRAEHHVGDGSQGVPFVDMEVGKTCDLRLVAG